MIQNSVLSPAEIETRLQSLREEHRTLDGRLENLMSANNDDQILLMRLKKEKLSLRDKIQHYEDMLNPDIIA